MSASICGRPDFIGGSTLVRKSPAATCRRIPRVGRSFGSLSNTSTFSTGILPWASTSGTALILCLLCFGGPIFCGLASENRRVCHRDQNHFLIPQVIGMDSAMHRLLTQAVMRRHRAYTKAPGVREGLV